MAGRAATIPPEGEALGRVAPGRRLLWALAIIALLRLLLGLGLYWAAPGPNSQDALYQVSERLMAPDAPRYHAAAVLLERCWSGSGQPFRPGLTPKYFGYPALLAAFYHVMGPNIWIGLVLNALAWFITSWLAFHLAARLGRGPVGAAWAALLVALWPPSLSYCTVLIKDTVFLCCVLGVFLGLVMAASPQRRRDPWVAALFLLPVSWVAMTLRPDFAMIALATAGVAGLLALIGAAWRWRPWLALGALVACLAVGLAAWQVGTQHLGYTIRNALARASSVESIAPPPGGRPAAARLLAAPPAEKPGFIEQAALDAWRMIWAKRWSYAAEGAASTSPDAMMIVDSLGGMARMVASGMGDLLLFPYPWQRWPSGGGSISLIITAQSLLWYALLPGLFLGLGAALARRPRAGLLLLFWLLVVGCLLAMVVVNLGTLYRMRDLILLPLLSAVSLKPYAALWNWVRQGSLRQD